MTKTVRIENADTSDHRVVVQTWDENVPGVGTLVEEIFLNNPTDMVEPVVFQGRYIVIREY